MAVDSLQQIFHALLQHPLDHRRIEIIWAVPLYNNIYNAQRTTHKTQNTTQPQHNHNHNTTTTQPQHNHNTTTTQPQHNHKRNATQRNVTLRYVT